MKLRHSAFLILPFLCLGQVALAQDKEAPAKEATPKKATGTRDQPRPVVPKKDSAPEESDDSPPDFGDYPDDKVPTKMEDQASDKELKLDDQTIIGNADKRNKAAGSAYAIEQKDLDRYEYDDPTRILRRVPGVYVREEDGYGLRPNIGLRGANSERSSKIVLMEDGVLFGPAPYSAPAAYYFPALTRMAQVEVFKGPSSIKYGPNTIGGAINFVSRPVPEKFTGGLDIAYGSYGYRKANAHVGVGDENFGVSVEGLHVGASGFKELDGGGNTGFVKNSANAKFRFNTDKEKEVFHQVDVKLGYSDELSNETYLGITDGDFRQDPYRRYVSTQLGKMKWDWYGGQLAYTMGVGESMEFKVTGYVHDFERNWRKVNSFRGGLPLRDLLANPTQGQNGVFVSVLKGEQDSANPQQALLVGSNRRLFLSQGIQGSGTFFFETGDLEHELEVGGRLHYDRIRRFHTEEAFLVRNRQLITEGTGDTATTRNTAETLAKSFYVTDEIKWEKLIISPGMRVELIDSDFINHMNGRRDSRHDVIVLPGIGAFYELFEGVGVLGGVHRGFSPVSPGQLRDVDPEFAINYEVGFRLWNETSKLEVIGFLNDYSNLIADSTFSSGSPDRSVSQQFEGGKVQVYGLEVAGYKEFRTEVGVNFSIEAAYTLSVSAFFENFQSANPQFGTVRRGDELPYLPTHQLSATIGAFG
ncbi:MAG: TonB-dependent receptor, partial [Planctomycetota bacterium]|nr:TonB-dependent receptor [Planctomycetota bacterium]